MKCVRLKKEFFSQNVTLSLLIVFLLHQSSWPWALSSFPPPLPTIEDQERSCDPEDEFNCKDGGCIPKNYYCDGEPDCLDHSDEPKDCTTYCPTGEFECASGECIDLKLRCDYKDDCEDGWADERNCIHPLECSREDGKFLCNSKLACINGTQVCDKIPDCSDKSDEFPECEKSCSKSTAGCAQGCIVDPDLTKPGSCFCYQGYKSINSGNTECEDVDECQEFGICSQICTNTNGSYECSCLDGFEISQDKKSCQIISNTTNFLLGTFGGVQVFTMGSTNPRYSLIENKGLHFGLSYNSREDLVYWAETNLSEGAIWRSRLNGSDVETIVNIGVLHPIGIAVDWITNNIYFTDLHQHKLHIVVCSGDGKFCSVLKLLYEEPTSDNKLRPSNLALNPNLGLMFWTDGGEHPSIMRAGMDGTSANKIVQGNMKKPAGITVDAGSSRIYWIDSDLKRIESAKFDGKDRRTIKSDLEYYPYGLSVLGDTIYWADLTDEIHACNKFDGSNNKTIEGLSTYKQILGISIFHMANQPINRKNPCVNAGCSHICTLTPTTYANSYRCHCPVGLKIHNDQKTCMADLNYPEILISYSNKFKTLNVNTIGNNKFDEYEMIPEVKEVGAFAYNEINDTVILSDLVSEKIYEYHFKTGITTLLVPNCSGFVMGLDIDVVGGNLYWIESDSNGTFSTVKVMSLQTHDQMTISKDEYEHFVDIVVVPEQGKIFVAILDLFPPFQWHIMKMDLDGLHKQILYSSRILSKHEYGMERPKGLAYNRKDGRLYWTVNVVIESVKAVGDDTDFRRISTSETVTSGIASYRDKIYWTEYYKPKLHSRIPNDSSSSLENRPICFGNCSSSEGLRSRVAIIRVTFEELEKMKSHHPCSHTSRKIVCSHICLISNTESKYTCGCPEGMHLIPSNGTCILSPIEIQPTTNVPITGKNESNPSGSSVTDGSNVTEDEIGSNATETTDTAVTPENKAHIESGGSSASIVGIILSIFAFTALIIGAIIFGRKYLKRRALGGNTRILLRPLIQDLN